LSGWDPPPIGDPIVFPNPYWWCVGGGGAGRMKVDMKVVDDKLKIIDEVPSSAVEMSVKEKVIINIFLFSYMFSVLAKP
jgi:hypothetical protein